MRAFPGICAIIGCGLVLQFAGCSRNVEKPPEPNQVVQEAPQNQEKPAAESGRKRTLTLSRNEGEQNREEPSPAEGEPVQSASLYQGRESLLHEQIEARILPEDFLIGRLQDEYAADQDSGEIIDKVSQFLSSLKEMEIDSQYLHPDWKIIISRSLTIPNEEYKGFTHFRLGKIVGEQTRARLNVRLFSDIGRTEGEVFLEKVGGTWYISDVQIELSMLLEEYNPEGEFEPSTYRWLDTY